MGRNRNFFLFDSHTSLCLNMGVVIKVKSVCEQELFKVKVECMPKM